MRDAQGRFVKGFSGNPGGVPKDTITYHMEEIMGVGGKEAVAEFVKQAVLTGSVEFPDGRVEVLPIKQWQSFVEWLFDRLDGKPMQPVQAETFARVEYTSEDFDQAEAELEEWEKNRED